MRQPKHIQVKNKAEHLGKMHGHYRFTLRNVKTGKVRVFEYDNVVTTAVKTLIAAQFGQTVTTNPLAINYGGVGTGTNTPSASDTKLQTELARTTIASFDSDNSIAYITAFFDTTEGNGVLREAGLFAQGTAAADSGTLVSRSAINITKSSSETLTMDWTIEIT